TTVVAVDPSHAVVRHHHDFCRHEPQALDGDAAGQRAPVSCSMLAGVTAAATVTAVTTTSAPRPGDSIAPRSVWLMSHLFADHHRGRFHYLCRLTEIGSMS